MVEYSLFVKRDSFLHSLDPRPKIFLVFAVILSVLLFDHPLYMGVVLLSVILIGSFLGRIKLGEFFDLIKPVLPLILITFFLWPLFISEGEIIFSYRFISIRVNGFYLGAAMALRIASMVLVTSLLMMTTLQKELINGFRKLGLPYDYGLTLTIALRYIPTLANAAQTIMDAQRSRGLELDKGNIISKARKYVPILVPLVIISLKMAHDLSIALESRGFGTKGKRTIIRELKMGYKDKLFTGLIILFIVLVIVARLLGYGTYQVI